VFTRRQFVPPVVVDAPGVLNAVYNWILGLEQKGALVADYQEGTWTPTDGSAAGLTLTVNTAKYTKVGRLVVVHGNITYPVTASGANAQINGFPFTEADSAAGALYTNGAGSGTVILVTSTIANLHAAGGVAITNANLSGKNIRFNVACMI
jgi:hypothetical protein